jgi:hypothetical protein
MKGRISNNIISSTKTSRKEPSSLKMLRQEMMYRVFRTLKYSMGFLQIVLESWIGAQLRASGVAQFGGHQRKGVTEGKS